MLDWGKHSSLLQTFVNYGHKKFYNIAPRCKYFKNRLNLHVMSIFPNNLALSYADSGVITQ